MELQDRKAHMSQNQASGYFIFESWGNDEKVGSKMEEKHPGREEGNQRSLIGRAFE